MNRFDRLDHGMSSHQDDTPRSTGTTRMPGPWSPHCAEAAEAVQAKPDTRLSKLESSPLLYPQGLPSASVISLPPRMDPSIPLVIDNGTGVSGVAIPVTS